MYSENRGLSREAEYTRRDTLIEKFQTTISKSEFLKATALDFKFIRIELRCGSIFYDTYQLFRPAKPSLFMIRLLKTLRRDRFQFFRLRQILPYFFRKCI